MSLELKQHLKMSQQLVMTPQLQQAIKLLQLSRMELVDLIRTEMVENPLLEEPGEGEEESRAAFHRLMAQGWTDSLRKMHPDEVIYTFFDYFRNAYGRNAGLRQCGRDPNRTHHGGEDAKLGLALWGGGPCHCEHRQDHRTT